MAISFVGGNTAFNSNMPNGELTITMPAGIAEDDYAIAVGGTDNGNTDHDISSTGYTELADLFADDTNRCNVGVFRKIQSATPDSNVVIAFNHISGFTGTGVVQVFRGVDVTTPEDATTVNVTGIDGATPDPGAITTITADTWVIAIGASREFDAVTNPVSGYSNLTTRSEGSYAVAMCSKTIASPAEENPGTYADIVGQASDSWAASTVAIRPAAGGAGQLYYHHHDIHPVS